MPYQITQKRLWWLSSLGGLCGKYVVFLVSQGDGHFIRHNDYLTFFLKRVDGVLILQNSQSVLIRYYMKTEAIRQYEQIGAICFVTAGFLQQHHRKALDCTGSSPP